MKSKRLKKRYIILILLFLTIIWVVFTNTHIQTTRLEIKNSNILSGFTGYKIAVIADLHNKDWGNKLIKPLEDEAPDIIVIVGDLIDSSHTDLDIALDFIGNAKQIAPVYYVSGNHEAWSNQYETLKESLLEEDIIVLDDEKLLLSHNNDEIMLLGLQDTDFNNRNKTSIDNKLKELIGDYKGYKILLSHRPEYFESYITSGIDLALTGHAHGGQVRIPFIGGLVAPNQGFLPKYTSGVYSKGSTDMVVSRGLGNSIIPIRINNTPELVIVKLNN